MEKPVQFDNGHGIPLSGVLHLPPKATAGVVLCHGFHSTKERQHALALELEKRGLAVFRFDFYGHGESGGEFENVTITEELQDLSRAVDVLFAHGIRQLGLYGSSLGGLISILHTAEDSRVQALVLRAPLLDLKALQLDALKGDGKIKWNPTGVTYTSEGMRFKIKYWFYLDGLSHNAYREAPRVKCPVLIVHGDKDRVVPLEQSERLAPLLKKRELHVINGANHLFTSRERSHTRLLVADWFSRYLRPETKQ